MIFLYFFLADYGILTKAEVPSNEAQKVLLLLIKFTNFTNINMHKKSFVIILIFQCLLECIYKKFGLVSNHLCTYILEKFIIVPNSLH